ncbi:MAG: sodium-dependent transporter [Bacteroidales bacterium]|nr:sodium-dependent transporter [Bacteroidales bacterium]MCM1148039.1 sodium-dependent transporter [Bacteroidales bacterium]MCM1206856.1 sodium-dependent transporter [Bacillota bacterium]MCM1511003.1 sodium-dependent transporter [Clostridium sp.]
MENNRNTFSGSLGFVLAAAGSAVGLGNIWRFPYLAARDGGGLFLALYIILAVTFGFTLLITEVAIGRRSGQGPLTAYRFFNKRWAFLGIFSFIIPYIIYPYYCVIGGWVLKYLATYVTNDGNLAVSDGFFSGFITERWQPLAFMTVFAIMCFYIVYKGVEKGIEKYSRIIMPALLILVVFICIYSVFISHTDPHTGVTRTGVDGLKVYFIPNLEGMTLKKILMVALDATSQLFFSLSIAMGIMVTYGSYMKKDVNLGKAIDHIEIFDTAIAILAGMMIIPAVYVFMGTEGMSAGPGLIFVALPKVFDSMGAFGPVMGLAFFTMVTFAALTSAVSILEAIVSSVMDKWRWSRKKSVIIMAATGFLWSVIVCLGYNILYFEYELPNGATAQILDIFDYISNNILMPFLSICTCILFGWVVRPNLLIGEMRLNGYSFHRKYLYIVMLKFIVPVMLAILLLGAFGIY